MDDALGLARRKHPIHIWAYVIMPEHVHLLLWPTSDGFEVKALFAA
jgi:REP element-mobilizing transposase RayT